MCKWCDGPMLYRCEYHQYLRRPDHKQEFLTQWQEQYNTISDLQRREALMKAELHHRVNVS